MASQSSLNKIPTIEFTANNSNPKTSSWVSTRDSVVRALEEYGCFVAVYDKIPPDLEDNLFDEGLKRLFDLPLETKMKNVYDKPYYSYSGNDQTFRIYESMGINKPETVEGTQDFTNTIWPNGNDNFCETVNLYAKLASELEQMITRMVFERYGVENYYDSHKQSTSYFIRMNSYRAPVKGESNLGCHIHSDKSVLTILYQNRINGLEVKIKDGQWIFVEPPPSSFIVMAGDVLQGWSNDRIHAPPHRVIMSSESETRYSIAVFAIRNGVIEVPQELIDDEHPLRFKPFENFALLDYFATAEGFKHESTIRGYCGIETPSTH